MNVVPQSATLLSITPDAEALIELAGRTAYRSEDRITPDSAGRFIRMIATRGHASVVEHASATFRIVTDRGISHEIVRHRIASFTQESTRYCNYGKDKFGCEIAVIEPLSLTPEQRAVWRESTLAAERAYMGLLAAGCAPQVARAVLPTCLKTELVMTANFREWKHFIALRMAKDAHPSIQQIAGSIRDILALRAPSVFGP